MLVPHLDTAAVISWHRLAWTALLLTLVAAVPSQAASPTPVSVSGTYNGSQMEIGAAFELKPTGRFRYELSYGALDEEATGGWTLRGDEVLLTSDPVVAPRFVVVSRTKGTDGLLRIIMDFKDSYDQQNFDALITKGDGTLERVQLGIDGLSWPFPTNSPPSSLRLLLGVFDLASEPLSLEPGAGYLIHYRFEPNDLGKVDFRATPLRIVHGGLLLERFGRKLMFKRVGS